MMLRLTMETPASVFRMRLQAVCRQVGCSAHIMTVHDVVLGAQVRHGPDAIWISMVAMEQRDHARYLQQWLNRLHAPLIQAMQAAGTDGSLTRGRSRAPRPPS